MRMARKLLLDGVQRRVIENLGFHHSTGKYVKVVRVDGEDVTVVSRNPSGPWVRHVPMIILGSA